MTAIVPRPMWWIWTPPGNQGPAYHELFERPSVGLNVLFFAHRTDALSAGNGGPPFAAAGVTPFEGDGNYGAAAVYVPGDAAATEANCVTAAVRVAKRTIDWVRCYIALYGRKPMNIFLLNWGNSNSGADWNNSIALNRCPEDAIDGDGSTTAGNKLLAPFTARARHYMRIWGEAYADFLHANLDPEEASCIVRMHFDIEEMYAQSSAQGTNNGWLYPLIRGTGSGADLSRYANEIVDGFHTLEELYLRDRPRMMEYGQQIPAGATSAPFTAAMVTNNTPYELTFAYTHYRNSVIRDWYSKNLHDTARAWAMHDSLFVPMRHRFPWIRTSEWAVNTSRFPLDRCTYRTGIYYSATQRNYLTDRYVDRHVLDMHNDVQYIPEVHPVSEFGPAFPGLLDGLDATIDDYPEACLRLWREGAARIRAAELNKKMVPWIGRPGRPRTTGTLGQVKTISGSNIGDYTLGNDLWMEHNRSLFAQGVDEILVWNVITQTENGGTPATQEQYIAQWDLLAENIDSLAAEAPFGPRGMRRGRERSDAIRILQEGAR